MSNHLFKHDHGALAPRGAPAGKPWWNHVKRKRFNHMSILLLGIPTCSGFVQCTLQILQYSIAQYPPPASAPYG